MSETDLGREPVELVELLLPKCANVHGVFPCTASQTGNAKCFNTRATCNDRDNYQARPLSYLTPDLIVENGSTGSHALTGFNNYILEVDFRIPLAPDGVVFEIGGGGIGLYVGFTDGDLIVRCGNGAAATGADVAKAVIDPMLFLGGSYTLIATFARDTGVSQTVTAYLFDPLEMVLHQLGASTSESDVGLVFGGDAYGVGTVGGSVTVGESAVDFNGTISVARFYSDKTALLFPESDAYRQRYFFDDGRGAKPSDDLYILPALLNADAVGTRLNISGADGRYEALGRRAFMSVGIADFAHTDFIFDPYLADRSYDPLERGTFWPKWQVRNKFGKTRALVRRYTGYNGQSLSGMLHQTYVLDKVAFGGEQVRISCRDFLSLTEFSKVQVPAQSEGKLDAAITAVQTTITLTGDVTGAYPMAGTLRIEDELMTYTARAVVGDATNFTGVSRGTDGSTPDEHDVDEAVQLCRRYTAERIKDIVSDLLVNDAQIPAQLVNQAKIVLEDDKFLSAYTLTTVLSEPIGVDQLLGELGEQCTFYIWWNERDQRVDFQAIRPLSEALLTLTQEANIVGDSFTLDEQPTQRVTTISLSFQPRDFAGDLTKPTNFRRALVISNSTVSGPDQYGKLPQTREIFSRWLQTDAQANQTGSRLSIRFADVPLYATAIIDAKDRAVWVGDFVKFSHDYLLNRTGARDSGRRWLVIEAEEIVAGHSQRITCVDITLDGQTYFITDNDIGPYDEDLFAAGNAFITDNEGLNPDGTVGATIG